MNATSERGARPGRALARRVAAGVLAVSCHVVPAADRLPALGTNVGETTVSGLSSGGFMAVQFHLAHASIVAGAAVFAGGPWGCARSSAARALGECMQGDPDLAPLVRGVRDAASAGVIDPLAGLAHGRVWLFSGYNDGVVRPAVMRKLAAFYGQWLPPASLFFRDDLRAGHALVTATAGGACDVSGGTFIADCDYDAAGSLLQFLYGRLAPPSSAPAGRLVSFDQTEFIDAGPRSVAMAGTGFAYIPEACRRGSGCRVHVALHGCEQAAEKLGDRFAATTGYNRWADTNRIVVLYPQARSTWGMPWNPYGCWDWWGYSSDAYPTKQAPQIAAIRAMVDRLAESVSGSAPVPVSVAAAVAAIDASPTAIALAWGARDAREPVRVRATDPAGEVREWVPEVPPGSVALAGLVPDTTYSVEVTIGASTTRLSARTRPAPPACDPWLASNAAHVSAGRAYVLWGRAYARGTHADLGWWNVFTRTMLHGVPGGFAPGPCP